MKKFTVMALCLSAVIVHAEPVTVFAAASLTNAMDELSQSYQQQTKIPIKRSYAASSTLAKQIEAGSPANIFMSADVQWVDYLQNKHLIQPNQRVNLLGNRLVMIAPVGQNIHFNISKGSDPSKLFKGHLCTGNTNNVPIGKYGKQALINLGWWDNVKTRLVETDDVRSALNFVERGECVGIVYATDAAISHKVKVVATFPADSYPAVIYPMAIVKNSPQTQAFYQYLQSSQAKRVYQKYGFTVLK